MIKYIIAIIVYKKSLFKENKLTQIDLTDKVRCLYQVFRPKNNITIPGKGNCTKCTYDPMNNSKCKRYYPIKTGELYVRQ